MSPAQLLGWVGAVALLLAYLLVSSGRLSGEGLPYQLLNIGGSVGLGLAAMERGVWPSVALNSIWTAIGLVVLARLLTRAHGARRACLPAKGTTHPG